MLHLRLIFLSMLMLFSLPALALQNTLSNNPSPYLKMHGKDPVAWQEWGEAAVEQARKENKLLFVSIGYFSCHWCHVMQRESYQNNEIATILNEHFIPVKVDRELNPALDSRLIDFVQATRGYSGWPLNVFITPEGYPLVGLVYLPANDFKSLISKLQTAWQEDGQNLTLDAAEASKSFTLPTMNTDPNLPDGFVDKVSDKYVHAIWEVADEFGGGFGNESKFPSSPQLLALLKLYSQSSKKDKRLEKFLRITLDKMAALGLHDLIGGGFYRYTVDPNWHVPHFEKMLYDNAQLANIYLLAANVLQSDEYLQVAHETLDFMIRELRRPDGSFASSLSAIDNNNIEGGYYLYATETLEKTLSKAEYAAVKASWIQEGSPTTEDGHLPILLKDSQTLARQINKPVAEIDALLAAAKQKLFALRTARVLPIDDKPLAAWNGLVLQALARAVTQTDQNNKRREIYKKVGDNLSGFLRTKLLQATKTSSSTLRPDVVIIEEGQLYRSIDKQGKPIGNATLEDYAYVTQGLLSWAKANENVHSRQGIDQLETHMHSVKALLNTAWQRFYTENGWKLSEKLLIQYGSTETAIADSALPSPSGVLIDTTLRYANGFHRDKALSERGRGAMNNAHDLLLGDGYWFASHISTIGQWANYRFQ